MNPSPARNRAETTDSATYGNRRRTSSPSSSSTSVRPKRVLARHELALPGDRGLVAGAEQVALRPEADVVAGQPGPIREVRVELDALADEGDLLGVVELEAEGAGRGRRGQGRRPRPRVEDDRPQPGPRRAERGRAADHAGPDDDEVGRRRQAGRWRGGGTRGGLERHRAVSSRHVPPFATPFRRAPATALARRPRLAGRRCVAAPRRWPAAARQLRPDRPVHRRRQRARRLPGARGAGPEDVPGRRRRARSTRAGPARPPGSATLAAHGVKELRFAGGTWSTGDDSGLSASPSFTSRRTGRPSSRDWMTEFYETGAGAARTSSPSTTTRLRRRARDHRPADRRPQRRVVPDRRRLGAGRPGRGRPGRELHPRDPDEGGPRRGRPRRRSTPADAERRRRRDADAGPASQSGRAAIAAERFATRSTRPDPSGGACRRSMPDQLRPC